MHFHKAKPPFKVYMFRFTLRDLTFGCAVDITGSLEKSPSKKQSVELQASRLDVVGECNPVVIFSLHFEILRMYVN